MFTLLLLSPPCLYVAWRLLRPSRKNKVRLKAASGSYEPDESDPTLLQKHSHTEKVVVAATGFTYPKVRVFHCPHPQASKLPQLPLLVFIHGLGGSVAQFHPLLSSLVNLAPCLAIDLPGCGLSQFAPSYWDAYNTNSMVEFLITLIEEYAEENQEVVLVCHSMGCSLGALLASSTSPYASALSSRIKGIVALCPPAKPMPQNQVVLVKRLLSIPGFIFDAWRTWDKRGGTESPSVARFTGPNAEEQLKRLQVRFNTQSRTPVFRRMAYGALPKDGKSGRAAASAFVGHEIWENIQVPVLLIGGKDDPVTTADETILVASWLGHSGHPDDYHVEGTVKPLATDFFSSERPSTPNSTHAPSKLVILPSPASHALLYSPLTVRPVSSLIQNFLATNVTERLSLGWQLQKLTTEGKWDVKNLKKWQAVDPVSTPIAGLFRAMKTLREVDGNHTPLRFVQRWSASSDPGTGADGQGPIVAVVDISHDSPVYDPKGLEDGGIRYSKFPTVSKLPPSREEVRGFLDLIDHVRGELDLKSPERPVDTEGEARGPRYIAVHCHYGFNRTGFFLIAYLVERLGWPLQDAIDEFAANRQPGVRHSHFVDELWGRYWDWSDERGQG
ncbi:phosphatases II [Microthyrium microscopicum]|uniref:Phosphatases II n=1 Tax=Microthyrium microscopicum TaxID=703497 RepID=A0A6A6UBN9_9PEZI|nr:phosphatases II [Microthyrium microscopicum]